MIVVKSTKDNENQKLVATFLKRVKKAKTVQRGRKTAFYIKPKTKRQVKARALRIVRYEEEHRID
jgi:ribosomal protein S21